MANKLPIFQKFYFDGAQVEIGAIPVEAVATGVTTTPQKILVVNKVANKLTRTSSRYTVHSKLGKPYGGIVVAAPARHVKAIVVVDQAITRARCQYLGKIRLGKPFGGIPVAPVVPHVGHIVVVSQATARAVRKYKGTIRKTKVYGLPTTRPRIRPLLIKGQAIQRMKLSKRLVGHVTLREAMGGIVVIGSGNWVSGVSHYRNTNGVSNLSHNADGTLDNGSISRDKKDSTTEQWWIP